MNVFLWVLQGLLAAVFLLAGAMHATRSTAELRSSAPWVDEVPAARVRLIGVAELAGAAGLILPAATGVAPVLTPLAATGLALTMLGAAALHARRAEPPGVVLTAVLAAFAACVAVGRFGPWSL